MRSRQITCQLGTDSVMIGTFKTPFLEDYIQLIEKDEHIVFKCSYETMGRDFAKAFGV